jgi:hypothetical protein
MISTKKYIGVIDDCEAGTVGSFNLPAYMKGEDMIGARVTVELHDENGMPIKKRGKLIEILEEWS